MAGVLLKVEADPWRSFGPDRGADRQNVNAVFPKRAVRRGEDSTLAIVLDFANALWQRSDMLEEVGQRRRATGRRFFVSLVRGA
jgi:hypothetical protein